MYVELPRGGLGSSVIDEKEKEAVVNILNESDKLFRFRGKEKTQCSMLEEELCKKTGSKYSLFLSSGTAALTCALAAFGIGPGDEVIVPAYTYIATAGAVVTVGAVPVICNIDESLGMNPEDFENKITERTKAVIPVNMQGIPCKLNEIYAIARKNNLFIIEDCCQAVGAMYDGEFCGRKADAYCWSTNFYKVITSGEGGVFFTDNEAAFQRALYYSDPAIDMWHTIFSEGKSSTPFIGTGYRASEISATILRVQLSKLDYILSHMRELKRKLLSNLTPSKNYILQSMDDTADDCGFSVSIIFNEQNKAVLFEEEIKKAGINIGSIRNDGFPDRHVFYNWKAIIDKNSSNRFGYPWNDSNYKGNESYELDKYKATVDLLNRTLRLTLNMNMTEEQMIEVAKIFNKADEVINN